MLLHLTDRTEWLLTEQLLVYRLETDPWMTPSW